MLSPRERPGPQTATVWLAAFVLGIAACAPGSGDGGAPVRPDVPARPVPDPGLCRVITDGPNLSRILEGIEWVAPLRARILYRPDDSRRTVRVWYMSTSERGVVTGIDLVISTPASCCG